LGRVAACGKEEIVRPRPWFPLINSGSIFQSRNQRAKFLYLYDNLTSH